MTVPIEERGTFLYEWDLIDQNNRVVPLAMLETLTLTLYDKLTDDIINTREAQSILNVNDGTFNNSGHGSMTFGAADNVIVGDGVREIHIALFEAVWDTGTKAKRWELTIDVSNMHRVVTP